MNKVLNILTFALLLLGCGQKETEERTFFLQGAWTLSHVDYPTGDSINYSLEGGGTSCLIYAPDSMLYECLIATIPTGLVIMPTSKCGITLINKGGGELLYLEDGDPHPLTVGNDSTIMIQRNGKLYSYARADSIYHEWGDEMRSIIDAEQIGNEASHYVLSAKEREQASVIHWLVYAIVAFVVLMLIITLIAVANLRAKRRLQLQLEKIKEEHDERPQPVRQAMASVESAFFASDDYHALQRRMTDGPLMKEQDWQQVEQHLKTVYPGFTAQLRSLYPMSELEYQTCLLIKLRIAPTDIATVLARDVSTVSTVRSRLYKKVFGRKGGAKEWDEFVLSIGA